MVLMVLMVSPSNDSPSPSEPKNQVPLVKNLVVLVCPSTSPNSTAKNIVVIINNYNDRSTNQSKRVRGSNFSPEGDRFVLNAVLRSFAVHSKDDKILIPGIGGSPGQNSNLNQTQSNSISFLCLLCPNNTINNSETLIFYQPKI